jgi:hypothetical protein
MSDPRAPVYDVTAAAFIANQYHTLVTHWNMDGKIVLAHTPMGKNDIKCHICEGGARVYVETSQDDRIRNS